MWRWLLMARVSDLPAECWSKASVSVLGAEHQDLEGKSP